MRQLIKVISSTVQLLGVFILLGIFSGPALAADAQNSITALNVSTSNGMTLIKVGLQQPLASLPAGFTINTPPRIAFDFPNTANGLGKSVQEFAEGDLHSANIVQAGNRTRLVVNLNQMLTYDTKIDGNNLLITLHSKPTDATIIGSTTRFPEAKQSASAHELRDIDFRRGKNGEGRILVDLSDPGIGIDMQVQGKSLIVDFVKTNLPRNLQRKLDVADFATPVMDVDTFTQGENVRMVIEPHGLWEHAAYQTDNKFIIEVKPIVEDADKLAKGKAGYSGEKLTLNFQKIDVREALNVIADFTETNMVISDSVRGELTLRLKDVPWDQAFDIILQSRDLDMRKNGNVIQVAPREEMAAKEKLDMTARNEIADLEELRTESFQISYQKADALAALLSNDKQRILSKRGSAVVDARTNTLFIQDTPSHLEDARKMIKQIDVPVRQVMIEARVVEATDKFGRNLGVRLGYNSTDAFQIGNSTRLFGNIGANSVTAGPLAGTTMPANTPNVNLPIAGPAGTFSMLLFNNQVSKLLSAELTALETDSQGKIISSPRVVTSDQTEALIETGTEIPYLQATSSGATSVAFKKAVLSLSVKPQITPDDNVIMDIKVNKDSVGQIYSGIPSIDTNKVNTQVLVENGGTVVIGGVYLQTQNKGESKVPLLGDIPVLGFLFRSSTNLDNKGELLVFITPKIIRDAMSLK